MNKPEQSPEYIKDKVLFISLLTKRYRKHSVKITVTRSCYTNYTREFI